MHLTTAVPLILASTTSAFYIPGWSIRSYADGEPIPLSTNKLSSDHTQLTFAYHELPFVCKNTPGGFGSKFGSSRAIALNLGEVLRGDRIQFSDYELRMGYVEQCKSLCGVSVGKDEVERMKELVRDSYTVEWIVDNLPGATVFNTVDKKMRYYAAGFKLGSSEKDKVFINNHFIFLIRWRKSEDDPRKKVILAFEVYPKSVKPKDKECPTSFENITPLELAVDGDPEAPDAKLTIPYSYSVFWKEDTSISWNNRWDLYFLYSDESAKVHWMSVFVSLILALLLSGTVAMIMVRTLSREIQSYKNAPTEEGGRPKDVDDDDIIEDVTGWKLVHGDVFRAPPYVSLFAPVIGSGVQLFAMGGSIIILSAIGVLNPSYRGGFVSFALFLFAFAGVFSGYVSTNTYKLFGGADITKNAVITASIVPGGIFTVVFILNLFLWGSSSSTAIPFGTLVALLCIWLLILMPLVVAGGMYGFKRAKWEHPVRVNATPRQIPPQPWYLGVVPSIAFGGLIPFMVIFIELLYVFQSVWNDKGYYYVYGFLAVIVTILVITVAEISVVYTYFNLCSENYHWWWRSFVVGASPAVWINLYSVYYFYTKLHISGFLSAFLYFAYSGLACFLFGLASGTVGVLASYFFVRKIYTAIKTD